MHSPLSFFPFIDNPALSFRIKTAVNPRKGQSLSTVYSSHKQILIQHQSSCEKCGKRSCCLSPSGRGFYIVIAWRSRIKEKEGERARRWWSRKKERREKSSLVLSGRKRASEPISLGTYSSSEQFAFGSYIRPTAHI